MRTSVLAALAALALLGAAPTPTPSSSAAAAPARQLSVVCEHAPLWLFPPGVNRPTESAVPQVLQGARFARVSGPRSTLLGFNFYETDIPTVEPGFAGQHYWLSDRCAIPI